MRIATILPLSHIGILAACFGLAQSLYIGTSRVPSFWKYTSAALLTGSFLPWYLVRSQSRFGSCVHANLKSLLGKSHFYSSPKHHACRKFQAGVEPLQSCSIPSSRRWACGRRALIPTAQENLLGLLARGGYRRAMRVSSAGEGRSDAMAPSPADSVNGISILK